MIFLISTIAIAAATWIAGWWGVALVALVIGATQWRRQAFAWTTALAAMTAWAALLLFDAVSGRFGALASALGGVMRVPAAALVVVTLLFAALLGWSATAIGGEVGRVVRRAVAPNQG